jgi:surface protein
VRNAKGQVSQPDTVKITVRPLESCYDPANVGRIGEADWFGNCDRMLIVNTDQLKAVASDDTAKGMTGNKTYAIDGPDGKTYTFANSARNIFTGQVDNMRYLFSLTDFDQDIGYWDTANVTSMRAMFSKNPFNHDISNWDTSNVETMKSMFVDNVFFNQDIGDWDTSKVKNMYGMFGNAFAFNQDIGDWDTSNVTTDPYELADQRSTGVLDTGMKQMFQSARAFDQDISNWCVENLDDPPGFDTQTPPGFKDNIAKQPKWRVNCP